MATKKNKGHDNLIPLPQRTKEEQRRIAVEGGKASGEARRKRKALKESMNALLELPIVGNGIIEKMAELGIKTEDMDNSQLVVVALFQQACSGDVPAIKELRNLIGEDDAGKEQGMWEELIRGMQDEV